MGNTIFKLTYLLCYSIQFSVQKSTKNCPSPFFDNLQQEYHHFSKNTTNYLKTYGPINPSITHSNRIFDIINNQFSLSKFLCFTYDYRSKRRATSFIENLFWRGVYVDPKRYGNFQAYKEFKFNKNSDTVDAERVKEIMPRKIISLSEYKSEFTMYELDNDSLKLTEVSRKINGLSNLNNGINIVTRLAEQIGIRLDFCFDRYTKSTTTATTTNDSSEENIHSCIIKFINDIFLIDQMFSVPEEKATSCGETISYLQQNFIDESNEPVITFCDKKYWNDTGQINQSRGRP